MADKPSTTVVAPEAPAADGSKKEPNRYMVNIEVSKAFKQAIGAYAESHDLSEAGLARKVLADTIGYDLSTEPVAPRGRSNPAFAGLDETQKKAAAKDLRKATNDLIRKLLEGHEAELKAAQEAAIAKAKAEASAAPAPAPAS